LSAGASPQTPLGELTSKERGGVKEREGEEGDWRGEEGRGGERRDGVSPVP